VVGVETRVQRLKKSLLEVPKLVAENGRLAVKVDLELRGTGKDVVKADHTGTYTTILFNHTEILHQPHVHIFINQLTACFKVYRMGFDYQACDWNMYLYSRFRSACYRLKKFAVKHGMLGNYPFLVRILRSKFDHTVTNVRFASRRKNGILKRKRRMVN
jgi:hypothetical protein